VNWRRQNPAVDDADSALAPTLLPGQGAVAAPSIPQPPPSGDETQATMLRWFESAPTRADQTVDLRDRTYLPPQPPPPPMDLSAWMPETMPPPPPGEEGAAASWYQGPGATPQAPEQPAESWYAGPAGATPPPMPAAGWFTGDISTADGVTATPLPSLPIVNAAEATAHDQAAADPMVAASLAPATMAIPLPLAPADGRSGSGAGPGKIVVLELHGDQAAPTHAPVRVLGQGGPNSPALGIDASGDLKVDAWPGAGTATKQSPARRLVTMLLVLLGVVAGGAVVRSAMNSSEPVKVFGVTLSGGNGQTTSPTSGPTSGPTTAPASVPSVTQTSVVTKNGVRSTVVQVVPGKTTRSTSSAVATSAPPSSTTKASVSPSKSPTTSPTTTSTPPATTPTTPPATTTTSTPPATTTTTPPVTTVPPPTTTLPPASLPPVTPAAG